MYPDRWRLFCAGHSPQRNPTDVSWAHRMLAASSAGCNAAAGGDCDAGRAPSDMHLCRTCGEQPVQSSTHDLSSPQDHFDAQGVCARRSAACEKRATAQCLHLQHICCAAGSCAQRQHVFNIYYDKTFPATPIHSFHH